MYNIRQRQSYDLPALNAQHAQTQTPFLWSVMDTRRESSTRTLRPARIERQITINQYLSQNIIIRLTTGDNSNRTERCISRQSTVAMLCSCGHTLFQSLLLHIVLMKIYQLRDAVSRIRCPRHCIEEYTTHNNNNNNNYNLLSLGGRVWR